MNNKGHTAGAWVVCTSSVVGGKRALSDAAVGMWAGSGIVLTEVSKRNAVIRGLGYRLV